MDEVGTVAAWTGEGPASGLRYVHMARAYRQVHKSCSSQTPGRAPDPSTYFRGRPLGVALRMSAILSET